MAASLVRTAIALAALGCMALPAHGETLEELDRLSDLSIDEASGIAMAMEQAGRGEYLDALATLERLLGEHPKNREARLIHAIFLCDIDDKQGGLVEIDALRPRHYAEGQLDQARERCRSGPSATASNDGGGNP